MRQLRFVAAGDTDQIVLETTDGGERFLLQVDAPLRDSVHADLPRLHHDEPKPEPTVTPREIQVRVRAGESPESLAEQHGAALAWVLRFAAPVLDERERMAAEARRAKARRSTTEGQTVVFGEAVDERFAAHGIDPAQVRWDAHRREDAQWVIAAHWVGGQAERTAEWGFHISAGANRTVTPLDDTAADLLSDRPIRPLVVAAPAEAVSAVSLTLAPPLRPGIVAFPAMPDAHTEPLPDLEEVFDQDAVDAEAPAADPIETPPLPMPLTGAESEPADAGEDLDDATLPLPALKKLGSAHRAPHGPRSARGGHGEEADEQKAARAHVPSWDDILLGVRRKND